MARGRFLFSGLMGENNYIIIKDNSFRIIIHRVFE